jgi:phosphatidylserine decarboxylase
MTLLIDGALAVALLAALAWVFWRYVWFFRDPSRVPPTEPGFLSPADGTVVYVREVAPSEDVVIIKQGLAAKIKDIVGEDVDAPKIVIGIFMSPFNVHYNRAPLSATVDRIDHHPGKGPNRHMGPMHWRTLLHRHPLYENSVHIVQNERTVTRFNADYGGQALPFYVVQIGAKTVHGIDSYFSPGQRVERGQTFGMIRIGSQVDVILPRRQSFEVLVKPGQRVRAGETLLVR